MSTQVVARPTSAMLRRPWFAADAVVTGANAATYLLAAGLLVDLMAGDAATYRWLGGFLALYAGLVAAYAWGPVRAGAGWAVVIANEAWVAASLVVAYVGAFGLNDVGRGWVVVQAVVVGALALLQARSLRGR